METELPHTQHDGEPGTPAGEEFKSGLKSSSTGTTEEKERDFIFRLLSEEIRDRHELGKLEGWTPWLVCGALVSMWWFLIQDVWGRPLRFDSARAAFLIVSLTIFSLVDIKGTLKLFSGARRSGRHFSLLHATATALSIAAQSLWHLLIGLACLLRPPTAGSVTILALGIFFCFAPVVGIIAVVLIATRIPLPIPAPKPLPSTIFTLLMTALTATAIIAASYSSGIAGAQASDVRAGGIFALTAFAIVLLTRGHTSPAVLKDTLVELRQELVLGNLSTEDARQRTRVALQGMFLSDLVGEDTRGLLKFISDVRGLYKDAFQKIATLKGSTPVSSSDSKPPAPLEKLAFSSTLDLLQTYPPKIDAISKQYFTRLRNARMRIALASRLVKSAASDDANLMVEVNRAHARANADLERFILEFHEVQNAWNRWFPSELRNYEPFGRPMPEIPKPESAPRLGKDA